VVRSEAVGEEEDGVGRGCDEAVARDQVLYFRIAVLVCGEEGPLRPKCTGDACIDWRPIANVGSRAAVDCAGPGKPAENGPQAKRPMRRRRAGPHGRRRTRDKHGKCLKHGKKVEGPIIYQVFRGPNDIKLSGERSEPAAARCWTVLRYGVTKEASADTRSSGHEVRSGADKAEDEWGLR
jgi:hypothetical protein